MNNAQYYYSKVVNQSDCLKQQNHLMHIFIHNTTTNNNNNNNNHLPLIQMFIIDRALGTNIPGDEEKIYGQLIGQKQNQK